MDRQIKEYILIVSETPNEIDDFSKQVNNYLKLGWSLYGNHQFCVNWDKHNNQAAYTISQALVK